MMASFDTDQEGAVDLIGVDCNCVEKKTAFKEEVVFEDLPNNSNTLVALKVSRLTLEVW
jgi:hypothetical protein